MKTQIVLPDNSARIDSLDLLPVEDENSMTIYQVTQTGCERQRNGEGEFSYEASIDLRFADEDEAWKAFEETISKSLPEVESERRGSISISIWKTDNVSLDRYVFEDAEAAADFLSFKDKRIDWNRCDINHTDLDHWESKQLGL